MERLTTDHPSPTVSGGAIPGYARTPRTSRAPARTPPTWTIRAVHPADAPGLLAFYEQLSAESRHARFFGFLRIGGATAEHMAVADGFTRCGLVALAPGGSAGPGTIVGHLCLEPSGPRGLEIGIAVADPWQGQGIGRALLEAGLAWARRRQIRYLYGVALAGNYRILRLASALGLPCTFVPMGNGIVRATVTLDSADADRQRG